MTEPLYNGEAICKRWGDSSSAGRTVTLQLEDGGDHPFRGYEGERFAIVVVPIGNDEKPMKKLMGDAHTREDGVASSVTHTPSAPVSSPAKTKKRWHEMPPSQRAALLVKDEEFRLFLSTNFPMSWSDNTKSGDNHTNHDETIADKTLKDYCGIASKAQLNERASTHHAFFERIEGNFHAWRQAKQHGAA